MSSVTRNRGIDGARPCVDATSEGLDVLKALIAEPHGDIERTGAVVADNDHGGVGVKLGVSPGGDFAHRHQEGVW